MKQFVYKFTDGPFVTKEDLDGEWSTGNCRRAVQLYFRAEHGLFLGPDDVLAPRGYYNTGHFVAVGSGGDAFKELRCGDVIYAEKVRDSSGNEVRRGPQAFDSVDTYLISLHTAIFTGTRGWEIWHATAIAGGSCDWSVSKFLRYYRPIAAKRIVS